jgi:hypothetical protein
MQTEIDNLRKQINCMLMKIDSIEKESNLLKKGKNLKVGDMVRMTFWNTGDFYQVTAVGLDSFLYICIPRTRRNKMEKSMRLSQLDGDSRWEVYTQDNQTCS